MTPAVQGAAPRPAGASAGGAGAARADVAVVILTRDEEANLAQALGSVCGWAREVHVVDSFSTDATLEIAGRHECRVVQHPFENFSKQRNFALDTLPIEAGWVLFLDADEWLPEELKAEIASVIASSPAENGFFLRYRLVWMGKWIRHGYYPTWILRLFRRGRGRCEERGMGEHMVVEGATGYLRGDLVHQDRKGIGGWIADHDRYAAMQAMEMLEAPRRGGEIRPRLRGTQAQRRRWLRYHCWERLPLLVRPFLYFGYRYFLRLGFLDGRVGFMFHFLHALWYPFLIDVRYLELRREREREGRGTR